ncbi:MAG: hypothetical protein AAB875_00995 [Patescibacteria group bacterium]
MKNDSIKIPIGDLDINTGEFVEGGDPQHKLVMTDMPYEKMANYECDNCDFVTMSDDEAQAHIKETKHELWKKRVIGD